MFPFRVTILALMISLRPEMKCLQKHPSHEKTFKWKFSWNTGLTFIMNHNFLSEMFIWSITIFLISDRPIPSYKVRIPPNEIDPAFNLYFRVNHKSENFYVRQFAFLIIFFKNHFIDLHSSINYCSKFIINVLLLVNVLVLSGLFSFCNIIFWMEITRCVFCSRIYRIALCVLIRLSCW